jgi:hypothetical protein
MASNLPPRTKGCNPAKPLPAGRPQGATAEEALRLRPVADKVSPNQPRPNKTTPMITRLDTALKREVTIKGKPYVLRLDAVGFKLTEKGHRKGMELTWAGLVSGQAALASALNASLGEGD